MSLKRHPSVVFVGIDTLDDIRNNSYNELFVSGGCIVSDELVLNPDFMSHGRSGIRFQQLYPTFYMFKSLKCDILSVGFCHSEK